MSVDHNDEYWNPWPLVFTLLGVIPALWVLGALIWGVRVMTAGIVR